MLIVIEPGGVCVMPMEFYRGRALEPEELEAIRQQIEDFDTIEAIDPEMRGIVERNWPHLISKLPGKKNSDAIALYSAAKHGLTPSGGRGRIRPCRPAKTMWEDAGRNVQA